MEDIPKPTSAESERVLHSMQRRGSKHLKWSNERGFVDDKDKAVYKVNSLVGNSRRKTDGRNLAWLYRNARYLLGLAVREKIREVMVTYTLKSTITGPSEVVNKGQIKVLAQFKDNDGNEDDRFTAVFDATQQKLQESWPKWDPHTHLYIDKFEFTD